MKSHKTIGFHYGYVIVACCFLIMFVIVGLVMSCAGIFYKPVSEELGVDIGKFGLYTYGESILWDTVSTPSYETQSAESGIEYAHAIKMPIFYGLVVFAFLMNATATLNVFVPTYMQEIQFSVGRHRLLK